MKKLLTFLMLLALAIPAWAGEKTITISRNEGEYEVSNGVYTITKGGVQLVMTGGMNNPNYLLMMQQTTMTFLSNNYKIKKIVFHCMDNTENTNLDCFFWGPTTLSVQKNISHNETPGTYTAPYQGNSYDGCWVSSPTYAEGLPTSYELMFKNQGKPVRFASIDVVIEKDQGDIFDLVTSTDELKEGQTYVLVSQYDSRALSNGSLVNGPIPSGGSNYRTQTYASTPITWPLGESNKTKVKTTDNVQFITLGKSDSNNRPWVLKVGENYIRRQSGKDHQSTADDGNRGWDIYNEDYSTNYPEYFRVSIAFGTNYNALIRYYLNSSETSNDASTSTYTYAIRHYNSGDYFRFINYEQSTNSYANSQRVFLYKPSINYRVLTGCNPEENNPGYITLGDGVLDISGVDYSQYGETVTFFVGQQNGYQIESVNVYSVTLDDDGNITSQTLLYSGLTPTSTTTTGSNFSFTMPESHVYVEANFTLPTYYGITTVCNPTDGGAITMTGGVAEYNNIIEATAGSTVTFTVSANEGFLFDNVVITDSNGDPVNYTYDETTGTYTYVMPATPVTITANFKTKKMITTACEPDAGGYFSTNNMTCNGESTNFYNGAQYYEGDVMGFKVFTNWGYRINKVTVTDADGNVTTLTPTSIADDGNNYSFAMPNSDVTIIAYFYESVPDLYLLGTHNGNTAWHSYGPKFDYNADTQTYSIEVYYKGVNTNYSQGTSNDGDKYGYFSFTKSVKGDKNGDDWSIGPRYGSSTKDNDDVLGSYDNPTSNVATAGLSGGENCFKVPAGVYRIEVNKDITQTTITRLDVDLTFSPAGGNDEASAPITSYGTKVTMNSPIQTMVHNIADDYATDYPQYIANGFEEVDMSMEYSIAETTDLNTVKQSGTPTVNNPTFTLLDYNIADGEPVVKVDGDAWLGWIHADNTAYYKVIYTPLKWIEEEGTEGHKYTVADKLIIMHKIDRVGQRLLWAKDQSSSVTDPYNNPTNQYATYKTANQTDYLDETYHVQAEGWGGWDQSNWVMLRFSEDEDMSQYHVYQTIQEGTLVGTYVDDVNFCINVETMETGGDVGYVPNTFCTANFLDYNLNLNNTEGAAVSPSGKKFFFMNPKVQEVADVTLAVWDKTNSRFVMPSGTGVNQAGITGFFTVNCLYNKDGDVVNSLVNGNMYSFRGVLNMAPGGSNAAKDVPTVPDTTKMVMPFDLNDQSVVTAISDVDAGKTVSSVKFYNITGMESDKPFSGVNIVVTRYTDGSFSTTKVLR